MEEDVWITLDEETDLNIHIANGRINIDIYPVVKGQTITRDGCSIFSISINRAKERMKEKLNICPQCQRVIFYWESGCQYCQ